MAYISFQPSDFFNTKLYTGTGSSNAVTGVGFQPNMCWFKDRDAVQPHVLFDSSRGANKRLYPNTDAVEGTETQALMSFDSDGFTLGTWGDINNTDDFVSWNWKAGTTSGISGSPSITPDGYSFNATSGFSIIKYTGNGVAGATLPHGLGVAPNFIIVKKTSGAGNWDTYHSPLGATKYMLLDSTVAVGTATSLWNDTEPTSTLFSLGTYGDVNVDTQNFIAYCFTSIKGYSSFGLYTGNGNADGPFAYTGFRPAFVMIKRTNHTTDWRMYDNTRLGYNPDNNDLAANTTAVEGTGDEIDLLSNGFKIRIGADAPNPLNGTSAPYIYMAFAEFPFVSSNSKAGTAR